jgi:Uncharacterized conserved protein
MLDFPGSSLQITDEAAVISCQKPLSTLSSALVGGGFSCTQTIINYNVPARFNNPEPALELYQYAQRRAFGEQFVGLMTAVPMRFTKTLTLRRGAFTVAAIITAGLCVAEAAGLSIPIITAPGTINIIVLVDANLVASAMVNAIMTVTEAKVAILVEHDVRTMEGYQATGTITDAVVLGCTGRGEPLPYAGPGTEVGACIGACVRQCMDDALLYWRVEAAYEA